MGQSAVERAIYGLQGFYQEQSLESVDADVI